MSTKATAARIYKYGEPDVFRFETMDVPDPVGHEVLVRNTVIGLNFVDIYYRRGTLPVPEFPAIIGDEASGVVEAVGPNVTLVKVGDRVAYADAFGAYTTVRLYRLSGVRGRLSGLSWGNRPHFGADQPRRPQPRRSMRWADVYVPHVSPASMASPRRRWRWADVYVSGLGPREAPMAEPLLVVGL